MNNWTPLIFFVLFHDYLSLQMFAYMDAPLKNVYTASLRVTYTTHLILGRQTPHLS